MFSKYFCYKDSPPPLLRQTIVEEVVFLFVSNSLLADAGFAQIRAFKMFTHLKNWYGSALRK